MNRKNGFSAGAVAVLASTLALLAGTAQALDINATWSGAYKGGKAYGTVPALVNNVLVPQNASGGGGLFKFTQNFVAGSGEPDLLPLGATFLAFCVEFNENISRADATRTYTLTDLKKAPVDANGAIAADPVTGDRMGAAKANLIAAILQAEYPGGPVLDAALDAATGLIYDARTLAVQFALWEIVHETLFNPLDAANNFGLNVLAGNAKWTSENGASGVYTIRNLANVLIDTAVDFIVANPNFNAADAGLRALVSLDSADKKQDFVVWVPRDPPQQDVPLPAAAWLLLSGMVGLFGIARRRKAS